MGKNIIWTNDSEYREGEEEYIKNEWIDKVRGELGLDGLNGYWIPLDLVDAVKQAAINDAIDKAIDNHEETINFVQAYRDFAQEENIGEIIGEQFGEQLTERADESISD